MNPTSFLQPSIDDEGTFTDPIGSNISADTPLTPFTMADGKTLYTSNTARNVSLFGYSYAEVPDVSLSVRGREKNELI